MTTTRGATQFVSEQSGKDLIVAEVGVRSGKHALTMLNSLDIKELYLIDHFLPYVDGTIRVEQSMQNKCYKLMFNNLIRHFSKMMFITRPSEFAATLFPDKFFDFVYIDSDHKYNAVKSDIKSWYPKVKNGGYLGGHDYRIVPLPGVVMAVDEFLEEYNKLVISFEGRDWLIRK